MGRIEVITGSVCCGKSEELIRRLKRAEIAHIPYVIFKSHLDTRDGSYCKSRNGKEIEAKIIYHLDQIWDHVNPDTKIVAFDEAEFFEEDLWQYCNDLANDGIRVIISGLNMDYRGVKWPTMSNVMAVAELVNVLPAICVDCYENAYFSYKLSKSTEIVDCDSEYVPLCRVCYNKRKRKEYK